MDGEEVIIGPGSYERYDEIAILCQKKYFRLFKLPILVPSLIAFLSLLPPFSETGTDIIKHSIELIPSFLQRPISIRQKFYHSLFYRDRFAVI